MPFLIHTTNAKFTGKYEFAEKITIGKLDDNDITPKTVGVSRHHAYIQRQKNGRYLLYDRKSTNGTYAGTRKLTRPYKLSHNSTFRILNHCFTYADTLATEEYKQLKDIAPNERETDDRTVVFDTDVSQERSDHNFAHKPAMTALLMAMNAVSPALSEGQLKERLLKTSMQISDATRGMIILKREDDRVNLDKKRGFDGEHKLSNLKISQSTIRLVLDKERSVIIYDEMNEERPQSVIRFDLQSVICVPLRGREKVFGCIYLDSPRKSGRFTSDDMLLIKILANHIYAMIENQHLHKRVKQESQSWEKRLRSKYQIITKNRIMKRRTQDARKYARFNVAVLILGEPGTGKELFARLLHTEKHPASDAPFISVNCAALPDHLIERELFGHVKGAFTGARDDKPGLFEAADRGTIFLDEIGELKPDMQSKLLRVLQEREIRRIGATKDISVNVKVVAATNKNIKDEKLREQIGFRDDLYSRLEGVVLEIPPLRKRPDDIAHLAAFFMKNFYKANGLKGNPVLSDEVLNLFNSYHWPGNVRELQNVIQSASIHTNGLNITPQDLPSKLLKTDYEILAKNFLSLEKLEKQHIIKALELTNWKKADAYKLLGIAKDTLRRKIIKHDLKKA
ncbi:sigma 54-interacting transcriptional regulator [Desulfococcaceae bacterium HSG7]|nr:sigma 54-interacting transcriptional regulator [Desulfococcaceae bacterium HSG7]